MNHEGHVEHEGSGMRLFKWVGKFLAGCRLYFLIPGVLLLLLSTAMFIGGTFWPWGWAVGMVLLFFSGKSSSEKKGYRF
jgi:hypothetical protein